MIVADFRFIYFLIKNAFYTEKAFTNLSSQGDPLCPLCVLRKATEKEVEWLLTWMLDFAGDERMLKLYKRVCRAYWQSYPETVAYYIMEYRKWYDPESLIIVERKFFRYAST